MAEFYVEQQGWVRWPKVLIMCRKNGRDVTRRRYVPEVETGEGMSITEELRKHAGEMAPHWEMGTLLAIADHIDAEHESACGEAYGSGVMSVPIALDESQWVRLPVDADGLPVHIGDVMEWPTTGETFEVVGIGDGTLFYVEGDDDTLADWTGASTKRHHAPTVVDVLREFGDWYAHTKGGCDEDGIVAEFAARLQLREDA